MKQREYAVSLGLAKPGGRGRLSAAAKAAISKAVAEGQKFSDYSSDSVNSNKSDVSHLGGGSDQKTTNGNSILETGFKALPETHDYSTVYGIDPSLKRPVAIAFQWCAKCLLQVKYCLHDIPQLPEYMGGGDAWLTETEALDSQNGRNVY